MEIGEVEGVFKRAGRAVVSKADKVGVGEEILFIGVGKG